MKLKLKNNSSVRSQVAVLSENVTEDKFERVVDYSDSGDGFGKLIARANDIQSRCTDVNDVDMGDLALDSNLRLERVGSDPLHIGMTPYAFSQLCTKLGVPSQYMKKCIEAGEIPLVMDNITTWLENFAGKKLLIRKYDDVARGILSDRYSVCDTPEILSAIEDSHILDNMSLKGYMINPSRFHARFVGEKMKVVGEDLFAGIQIDSSDVGRSRLDIKFLVFKQVCTNGLILPKTAGNIFMQKHIGISSDKMAVSLRESFNDFNSQVKDATSFIDKARNVDMSSNESLITHIKNGAKVGDDTVDKIIEVASIQYDMSLWGIVNAITEVSQTYTLEHRLLMERYAGVLMTQFIK